MMKKIFSLLLAMMMLAGFACAEANQQPADLLTDSVLEGKLVIDGVFYQMPVSVQLLLENGWTHERNDMELEPANFTFSVFVKDNKAFYAQIINEYPENKMMSECHVAEMQFGPKANGCDRYEVPDVQFAKQVNINTTKRELEKALGEPSSTAGGYPVWRGANAKYINPGISFGGLYEEKLFSSELKYFVIAYMPADFTVAE